MRTDTSTRSTDGQELVDVDSYRAMVKLATELRRFKTALFWAEKVTVLSNDDPRDVYWEAQCMFHLREYQRAAKIICSRELEKRNLLCQYLAAECMTEAKEYQAALDILSSVDSETLSVATTMVRDEATEGSEITGGLGYDEPNRNEILASVYYLKGKVLEAMDNRSLAMDCYVQALNKSVYCTEALDALVQHDMLMAWEEKELLQQILGPQQCTEPERKILKRLYESKLKKYYESIVPLTNPEQTPALPGNASIWQELKEKMKNSKNTDCSRTSRSFLTPRQKSEQSKIMSPAKKLLEDIKNTPSYLIHTSLTRASLLGGGGFSGGSTALGDTGLANNTTRKETPIRFTYPLTSATGTSGIPYAQCMSKLENSIDLLTAEAEQYFYRSDYKRCMKTLDAILKRDPYHRRTLTVQIGCLAETRDTNQLFYVAHKLVDFYPDDAISWYAVGCYYDLIGKSDHARRYLSKATSLDRLFGPAWLAYGHSFAKENEHDQAMAAYFKATQLMRGCHLPLLYIGVECGLTKNPEMAEKFFYQAMTIAPLDVYVLHELGVIKFENEQYESAEQVLRNTLDMVRSLSKQNGEHLSVRWEAVLNNLGHCCRKNKKYDEALEYHRWALSLNPLNAKTFTAIGFVQALTGQLSDAVDSFHKSLSLKRDDVFTTTLLKQVIEDLAEEQDLPFFSVESADDEENADKDGTTVEDEMSINSVEKPSNVRPNPIGTDNVLLPSRVKLRFDECDSNVSALSDTSADDMSMDI
ncbi:cell division cycle protein 16 homolog [Anopheles aquasalis]|uniref:cell division cycle protein 16 homolog n=1 Tax=Anopheles aquasalis TaxID=42839 RepID=UPI00215B356E|nr:cell division cycle protein 16 homolog [Anopheles aquasalis]